MTEAEQVMKRCQIGTRNYNEANNLHADCYQVIGKLLAEHAMREVQRLGQEIEQKIGCVNHDCDQCKAQRTEQEPVAWLSTDSIGERHLCFDKPLDNDPVQPLYTSPPQRTERNFCERCGKRTKDIHTCTPPKEGA